MKRLAHRLGGIALCMTVLAPALTSWAPELMAQVGDVRGQSAALQRAGGRESPDGEFASSATASFQVNFGLTGAWFDPATPGQGLLVEVIPASSELFVAWFTFDDQTAKLGAREQRWFTAQGTYTDAVAVLVLSNSDGGVFDDPTTVQTTSIGTATLAFQDCNSAEFAFEFDEGPTGSFPLVRIAPDVVCAALGGRDD